MSKTHEPPRKPKNQPLRQGWTTGACATGAAAAAYRALRTGSFAGSVTITLPRGQTPTFDLKTKDLRDSCATAGIVKDAGDDPDVTHGLEIIVTLTPATPGDGVQFRAGPGVGTVTLAGLPLNVGEPAINPGPRAQIQAALLAVAQDLDGPDARLPDVTVEVTIPKGEETAQQTMNPRLGIVGGLSVLGTTGIVVPFSCSSWIHSIHRGVDVARAAGLSHVLAATGRTSEHAANTVLQFEDQALIDMGDFAGGLLKYLRGHPVDKLTIAGGFAKMTKLAQGAMDLHSSRSRVDFERLANALDHVGGGPEAVREARETVTAMRVLQLAGPLSNALATHMARQAREVALATLAGGTEVEIWIYDRDGTRIGLSS
ncbi:cobalt-precorrin-5B (C(1))-methyltransferase [Magnetovibrio sp. PR-2]|uniref:cobalt-precorrin-5B (C(1))-methyltransferase n=1 Tax=Magnetovibrio sp. PR-2 TaxID=3120356 RepID=UPI002FCE3322